MITARDRVRNVLAAVEAARALHPAEFTRGVSPKGMARALVAEEIDVIYRRIRRPARVRGFDGTFVITLRSDLSRRDGCRWALHEYAHIKLGHFDDGDDVVKQLSPCRKDDPRELEAKLFAQLLASGQAIDDPAIVDTLVAQLEPKKAPRTGRAPAATREPTPTDFGPGVTTIPAAAFTAPAIAETPARSPRRSRPTTAGAGAGSTISANPSTWFTGRTFGESRSDDDERLTFYDQDKGAARLRDESGMPWWIYNYRIVGSETRAPRRELVRDFMSPTISYRLFVNAAGVRKLYRFPNRAERRDYATSHLDRQLREARYLS